MLSVNNKRCQIGLRVHYFSGLILVDGRQERHLAVKYSATVLLGGVMVRTSDLLSSGRGFDSRPGLRGI